MATGTTLQRKQSLLPMCLNGHAGTVSGQNGRPRALVKQLSKSEILDLRKTHYG